MKARVILAACAAVLLGACGGADGPEPRTGGAPLRELVERARAEAGLPGLAAVVVEDGAIDAASSGSRIAGEPERLLVGDPLQMGSQTKAATAMLIARLVEHRRLRWDSSMGELFPQWRASMDPQLRAATVEQMLRHRGGLKHDLDDGDAERLRPLATGVPSVDRRTVGHYLLHRAPAAAPDRSMVYSNLGYLLLGLAAEEAAGLPYEELMRREVFAPLGIEAGFGFPEDAGAGSVSGHVLEGTAWRPVAFGGEVRYGMDMVQPAGGMMLSMAEYGKLLRAQLAGLRGGSDYLSADTVRRMHTPLHGYAHGWAIEHHATGGVVSVHAGSWGSYYVYAIVAPGLNRAVAVGCNCYGAQAMKHIHRLAGRLAFEAGS
ncbi:serine hydrolase [Massilia sp. ZL223]|uniref:serine hydrolase domain-containing protein n=1 Tax=Massilia sp. ZL223 TaxID=2824904 RepID=UPI001B839E74|nr:serine hydrolase domain-containing protein [Massilia sp. ZL223]MBQ5962104.1 beta-lactamase family protein [Massilia sp. ZL223]